MCNRLFCRCLNRWTFYRSRHKVFKSLLVLLLMVLVLMLWNTINWFPTENSNELLSSMPPNQSMQHFRRSRNLQHYLKDVKILIQPWSLGCEEFKELSVIILVSSVSTHFHQRQVIRKTWAQFQPTYFVLGIDGDREKQLKDNQKEATIYSDLIVFDFHSHYQNQTLKTALMMNWVLNWCSKAQFMFKIDDDVLVNPWTLHKLLKKNKDAPLIGYSITDTLLDRDEKSKRYIPRWLLQEDKVPKYLSGSGYIVNVDYIKQILNKAYEVPLINLEDVYYTYLIAQKELTFSITHDRRLKPTKPWLNLGCIYWGLASVHGFKPNEMFNAWYTFARLVRDHDTKSVCWTFNYVLSIFHLSEDSYSKLNIMLRPYRRYADWLGTAE